DKTTNRWPFTESCNSFTADPLASTRVPRCGSGRSHSIDVRITSSKSRYSMYRPEFRDSMRNSRPGPEENRFASSVALESTFPDWSKDFTRALEPLMSMYRAEVKPAEWIRSDHDMCSQPHLPNSGSMPPTSSTTRASTYRKYPRVA